MVLNYLQFVEGSLLIGSLLVFLEFHTKEKKKTVAMSNSYMGVHSCQVRIQKEGGEEIMLCNYTKISAISELFKRSYTLRH